VGSLDPVVERDGRRGCVCDEREKMALECYLRGELPAVSRDAKYRGFEVWSWSMGTGWGRNPPSRAILGSWKRAGAQRKHRVILDGYVGGAAGHELDQTASSSMVARCAEGLG